MMYHQLTRIGWLLLLSLLWTGCRQPVAKTENKAMNDSIQWEKLPDLPGTADTASLGVSAPFTGLHQGKLIVAGGCNFPDKPVTEGGAKRYYDEIFLLDLASSQVADGKGNVPRETIASGNWQIAGKLPYPVAYGAAVSTPSGVICIGGNNSDSSLVRVACLRWDEAQERLETRLLPSLPAAMDNLAAAFGGNKVYVAGGNENGRACHTFLCLDLDTPDAGWQRLPDFPGPARVQPVLAAQQSPDGLVVYLAGGFQPIDGDEAPLVPTNVLAFHPATQTWTTETHLPPFEDGSNRTFTGGCGIAYGDSSLLFVGGVNYDRFLAAIDRPRQLAEAEAAGDTARAETLRTEAKAYMHHPVEWYRFNTSLLQYNTYTKEWTDRGDYEPLARAGAGSVIDRNALIIVNGELKPGIRTPQVNKASL